MKIISMAIMMILCVSGCARSGGEQAAAPSNLLDAIKQQQTIRVGVKVDAPPFGFALGQGIYAGFEIDIIEAVAREMGIASLTYVPVTSSERVEAITSGKVDLVIANMTITQSRDQDVDYSVPYFQDGQLLLVKGDSDIESYLDLVDKPVACLEGSTSAKNLSVVAPSAKQIMCKNNAEMLAALRSGKVQAITSDGVVLEGIRNKNKADGFKVVGDHFSEEPLAIALPENQSDLRDALNVALQKLWETGEWHHIFEAWLGPKNGYMKIETFHLQTYPQ